MLTDRYRKPKILVVDDDKALRVFLALEFSDWDYAVTEAENGKDAMDKMRLNDFDLILTDVKMPTLGGLELLSHVRRCFPDVPVILMSAFGESILFQQDDRVGAFACVMKPIVLEELHALVTKALYNKEGKP